MATAEEIWGIGLRAQHLRDRYYAHRAALEIARHPSASKLLPSVEDGALVPEFYVRQGDGKPPLNELSLHFPYFLERGREPDIAEEFDQVYFKGALLELGDALAEHDYLDRSPPLEFVRHLRNGIAHGNRFEIRNPNSLITFPAHTHDMTPSNLNYPEDFTIVPSLDGTPVLFDFIGPVSLGRVFDRLSFYIMAMGAPPPEPSRATAA